MAETSDSQKTQVTAASGATGAKPLAGGAAAGGATPPPKPPTSQREAKTVGLAWLREVTTTALAVAIAGLTLFLLWRTFAVATGFEQKKDVMLFGLTILGTVVGFYFGRVPAERRAEASEETAKKAQTTATGATAAAAQAQQQAVQSAQETQEATKKLAQAKPIVERAKAALAPAAGAQRKTLGAEPSEAGAPADRSREAYLELEVLSRLL